MKKKLVLLLAALGAAAAIYSAAIWRMNDGFHIKKIESRLAYSPKWEVSDPSTGSIRGLLSQNFYYIGKGSQCYVFESEDKEYILKFFRLSRYRLPSLALAIDSPSFLVQIRDQKKRIKEEKLQKLFTSCKIAYEDLQEETGLLYLHLNKTRHLKTRVTLFDKLKRPYTIEIDDYEFLIQKRGEQILPYLARCLKKGKIDEAKAAVDDLNSLMRKRLKKGIADCDPVIVKNSGFRAGKAMILDVGGFSRKKIADPEEEMRRMTAKLNEWLRTNLKSSISLEEASKL